MWVARQAGPLALGGTLVAFGALATMLVGPVLEGWRGARETRLVVRAAGCEFRGGFKALRDLIPKVVGDCIEDEHHNPSNGDGLQSTSGGLLVWRKADNWTAFTDGSSTWVNGPLGLQTRGNSERFPWESSVSQPPTQPQQPDQSNPLVQQAIADAAQRLGVAPASVTLVSVQPRDWSDSSLGCPRPGMMYAQVITPGYLITLEAAGKRLEYHTDQRKAELC
jgi:hypothetical protein